MLNLFAQPSPEPLCVVGSLVSIQRPTEIGRHPSGFLGFDETQRACWLSVKKASPPQLVVSDRSGVVIERKAIRPVKRANSEETLLDLKVLIGQADLVDQESNKFATVEVCASNCSYLGRLDLQTGKLRVGPSLPFAVARWSTRTCVGLSDSVSPQLMRQRYDAQRLRLIGELEKWPMNNDVPALPICAGDDGTCWVFQATEDDQDDIFSCFFRWLPDGSVRRVERSILRKGTPDFWNGFIPSENRRTFFSIGQRTTLYGWCSSETCYVVKEGDTPTRDVGFLAKVQRASHSLQNRCLATLARVPVRAKMAFDGEHQQVLLGFRTWFERANEETTFAFDALNHIWGWSLCE